MMIKRISLALCLVILTACSNSSDDRSAWRPPVDVKPIHYSNSELNEQLRWITNNQDPVVASTNAKRGGMMRSYIGAFPMTFRVIGPDSNGGFAGYMRALNLSLVDVHPNTGNAIPSLATHWAFGADGKTVYFKLDPDAKWSDGTPVTADDYLYNLDFMRSKKIVAPFYNNYYTKQITDIRKYDDHTISITSGTAKPQDELLFSTALSPLPRQFTALTDNWVRDYNWKIPPVTGAYNISKFSKGKFIQFDRQDNWWANNKRYYRHRFNPDSIRVKVIRNDDVAFRYFLKGELDTFNLVRPNLWYGKARGKVFDEGYILKAKFYNDIPQSPSGLWLNTQDPILADRQVRLALAHALDFDKVIKTVLRNDYERLNRQYQGYAEYDNETIHPREFDLARANQILDADGWQQRGKDGIRRKDGKRLSLRITYMNNDHTPRLVILRESAARAGIDLKLQFLDSSTGFKQILEKKHQIAWMGWSAGGIAPRFWSYYHSDHANRPQTNNITALSDPALDKKIMRYRQSINRDERIALAKELAKIVDHHAVFIPSFSVPYTRAGFWHWMKLPSDLGNRTTDSLFSFADGYYWIDEQDKQQVLADKHDGIPYAPKTIVNERYKVSQ
ncbi:extracellular solute-binding protein [Sinobacterium caligoides]|nr:extracellular solute-binding protein [Sinobacterium caligoides]